jgi:ferrochelatase
MRVKTGVFMINLGGPATPKDVEPFLVRMFSDTTFIQIPFGIGPRIARLRAKRVRKQYEEIGGSPLAVWTDKQGSDMVKKLDLISPQTAPHKFYKCFRYSNPLSEEACQEALADGAEHVVAFTQYPHYSCATTGNSLRELHKHVGNLQMSVISKWATHPAYIAAWNELIHNELKQTSDPSNTPIIFTAHSIPAVVMWRGDMYPFEIGSTVNSIMSSLPNPHFISWQSKVGFQTWLQPNTPDSLKKLSEKGYKEAILVPIAFTSEHLETLFELDLEYVKQAAEMGLKIRRCPAPNDSPLFTDALANIVKQHLDNKFNPWIPRCLMCPFPNDCKNLDFFKTNV